MHRSSFYPWIIFLILVGLTAWGVRAHSQSWYFQDETEHLAMGWMMLRFGRGLYTELSTNHQPIPVLVGGLLSQAIPYNSLYSLVERLRWVMFSWLVLSSAFLVGRFRWRGLAASGMLLSVSYWYLGWHLLAESLAAPAVAALLLYLFESTKKWSPTKWDAAAIGTALFWSMFNLLPLWPLAGLSGLWFLWKLTPKLRWWLALTGLGLTALLFLFISPSAWLEETLLNILRYFLPYEQPTNWPAQLLYPLVNLTRPESPIGRLYWLTLPLIIVAIWRDRQRKRWLLPLALLLTLNTRVAQPDATFYNGFHLFPYLAGWGALAAVACESLWQRAKAAGLKLAIAVVLVLLATNNFSWASERVDKLRERDINYGTYQGVANAIITIKNPGDALLTGPNGSGYLNLLTDLPLAGRQNFHLNWAWRSPKLQAQFKQLMAERPPTFIYFQHDEASDYYRYLKPTLEKDYYRLLRADGRETDLYFRQDAAAQRTPSQWQELAEQYFIIPADLR